MKIDNLTQNQESGRLLTRTHKRDVHTGNLLNRNYDNVNKTISFNLTRKTLTVGPSELLCDYNGHESMMGNNSNGSFSSSL